MEKRWPKNKTACGILLLVIVVFMLEGCGKGTEAEEKSASVSEAATDISSEKAEAQTDEENSDRKVDANGESELHAGEPEEAEEMMRLYVNDEELSVVWKDNESVDALKELVSEEPLTIEMSMYGGFEQVGSIGHELPRNDIQTTTSAGDIVLYSGDQIVVFYGSNSWSYTRLGHVEDKTEEELARMLGQDHVSLTFSMDE